MRIGLVAVIKRVEKKVVQRRVQFATIHKWAVIPTYGVEIFHIAPFRVITLAGKLLLVYLFFAGSIRGPTVTICGMSSY